MANTDRARKLLVRTALVTSTTIATLVGAQNLAMLDARQFQLTTTPDSANTVLLDPVLAATPIPVTHAAPTIAIRQAAPSITILRQSGQTSNTPPVTVANAPIQPPAPSQITAPRPVIVQQPIPQRSQSSR